MRKQIERIVLASFFLSGLAALIYETAWLNLTGLYFENTAYSMATVVAIFMAGLALGSYLAGRLARRCETVNWRIGESASNQQLATSNSLLLLYFSIEALIALFALAVPFLFIISRPIFGVIYRNLFDIPVLYHSCRIVLAAVMLLPTATLMGLTLPLLIEALTREHGELSRKSGMLYGLNALGAAVGATLCGFVLLPGLGTFRTILVGVAVNLVIAVVGWAVLKRWSFVSPKSQVQSPDSQPDASDERRLSAVASAKAEATSDGNQAPEVRDPRSEVRPYILVVFALSGFCALCYEIIWTRLMIVSISPAVYSFATILACFILGLALGSSAYAAISKRIKDKALSCGILLILAALAGAAATAALPWLPVMTSRLLSQYQDSFAAVSLARYLLAAIVILPLTVFSGALFPAAAAAYARDGQQLARKIGRLYAGNSVGSILGALVAGFVLLELVGAHRAGVLVVLVQFMLGIYVVARRRGRKAAQLTSLAAAAVVFTLFLLGGAEIKVLHGGSYMYFKEYKSPRTRGTPRGHQDVLYHKDGAAGTVTVFRDRRTGKVFFAVNGKVDGSSDGSDMTTQTMLAHLPMLLHGDVKDVLVIGFGTGTTFATTLDYAVATSTCVELSPQVIEAAKFFEHVYGGDPLRDPRARLVQGDGRSLLFFGREQYDVVTSEPSNPWMSGVANLFTRECFEAMKTRLREGGVACQWLHGYRMRPRTFRGIVRTFTEVFPHASLWWLDCAEGDFLLIGSAEEHHLSLKNLAEAMGKHDISNYFWVKHRYTPYTLMRCLVAADEELVKYAANAPLFTDSNGALGHLAAREMYADETSILRAELIGLETDYSSLLSEEDVSRPEVQEKLAWYRANRDGFVKFMNERRRTGGINARAVEANKSRWRKDEDISGDLAYALWAGAGNQYANGKKMMEATRRREYLVNAAVMLQLALSLSPGNSLLYQNLGIVLRDMGEMEQCLDIAKEGIDRTGPSPDLYGLMARALFMLGRQGHKQAVLAEKDGSGEEAKALEQEAVDRLQDAATALEKAVEMDAANPNHLTNLGLVYINIGKRDEATWLLEKALAIYPGHKKAREALEKLRQEDRKQ